MKTIHFNSLWLNLNRLQESGSALRYLATQRTLLPLLAFLLLSVSGCGKNSDRLTIHGRVTLDDHPLETGSILFIPKGKGPKVGARIKQGIYRFGEKDGPLPGTYRVEIYADDKQAIPFDDPESFSRQFNENPAVLRPENPIPETFNKKSILTAEPKADGQQIEFKLTNNRA